jgi:hypothetical protein
METRIIIRLALEEQSRSEQDRPAWQTGRETKMTTRHACDTRLCQLAAWRSDPQSWQETRRESRNVECRGRPTVGGHDGEGVA